MKMKMNIKKGLIDLEKFAKENIAIQCDDLELERMMMIHLDCLGVTTINGNEIYDFTYSFGEDILSYWYKFAENGYYLIKKSRTGRFFIDYSKEHTGETVNMNDFIEYTPVETKEVKDNNNNLIDIIAGGMLIIPAIVLLMSLV